MKNRLAPTSEAGREEAPKTGDAADQPAWANWFREAERYIAEHPKTTLGIGLALGVTLGWLIKRR